MGDMSTELPLRARRYLANLQDPQYKTKIEAAVAAGYSMNVARSIASHVERGEAFRMAMEEAGITTERLMEKLQQGLDAKRPFGKDADIYDDFATQHRFLETALKIQRVISTREDPEPPPPSAPVTNNTQINIQVISGEFTDLIRAKYGAQNVGQPD